MALEQEALVSPAESNKNPVLAVRGKYAHVPFAAGAQHRSHDKGRAGQSQVTVCRPARGRAALVHERQPVRVGKRQLLIKELLYQPGGLRQFTRIEWPNREGRQLQDEVQELHRAVLIVPAQEPAVALRDH